MIEEEEVKRLCSDEDVIHFVERIVGYVDTMDKDENKTKNVANAGQPFCDVVAE